MKFNTIYNEDCLTTLRRMENDSIDCVVTSPPYFGLRDYGCGELEVGKEQTPSEYIDRLVEIFTEVYRVLKPSGTVWVNIGDTYNGNKKGNTQPKWTAANSDGFEKKEWRGCKHKDLIGIPWMFAFAMRDRIGFYLRQDIIWHRPNQMPESVTDRCVKSHEYIFLLTKSEKYYFDYEAIQEQANCQNVKQLENIKFGGNKYGDSDDAHYQTYSGNTYKPHMKNLHRNGQTVQGMHANRANGGKDAVYVVRRKRDVWSVNTQPSTIEHCAMFPEKLIMPCIMAGCPRDGVVYDPFMGSGTTALATIHSLGHRSFIGSELNPHYADTATKRVAPELAQLSIEF